MGDIETRIQRLEDLEAIRTLVNRYAHLIWQNQPLETVELFAEEGSVDMGADGGVIQGRKNLQAIYKEKTQQMLLHPFVHNHLIELDKSNQNLASGTAYIDLRCVRNGQSLMGSGYYQDKYIREQGEWKFQQRVLTMNYLVPPTAGWE